MEQEDAIWSVEEQAGPKSSICLSKSVQARCDVPCDEPLDGQPKWDYASITLGWAKQLLVILLGARPEVGPSPQHPRPWGERVEQREPQVLVWVLQILMPGQGWELGQLLEQLLPAAGEVPVTRLHTTLTHASGLRSACQWRRVREGTNAEGLNRHARQTDRQAAGLMPNSSARGYI